MKSYDNFFLPVNDLKKAMEYYQRLGLSLEEKGGEFLVGTVQDPYWDGCRI
jgi:hypothetical protein